jgi:hypothetical protein
MHVYLIAGPDGNQRLLPAFPKSGEPDPKEPICLSQISTRLSSHSELHAVAAAPGFRGLAQFDSLTRILEMKTTKIVLPS